MNRKPRSTSSTSSFEDLNARLDAALAEQQKQQEKQRRTEKRHLLDAPNEEGSKPAGYGTISDIQSSRSKQNPAEIRREIVKASARNNTNSTIPKQETNGLKTVGNNARKNCPELGKSCSTT